ncbi:MAG: hypothetical protein K0S32_1229 [Bacteroidetes bacterium]|jgi:hypothetical protein|nr:hypothetical protein [Bacteroidota bacterium]
MKTLRIFIAFSILLTIIQACKKKEEIPVIKSTPYYIRMTDAPGPFSAVNINLQGVEIKGNGSTNAVMLNVNQGMYNLLNFSNGLDTLIATGELNMTKVSQIRLILGPGNSVVKNGVTYPLATPSAEESGLKLQVHQNLEAGVAYYVLLDFDANQSIVDNGNGGYSLKPVIRTIETALSGSIKGKINPVVSCFVTAVSGGISYSSQVNANGEFIIKGLPAGTYTLTVTPVSPYGVTTISNIIVTTGNVSNVGTVNI